MARPLRIEFPHAFYHVTARGNAGDDIFRDDADSGEFLELLGKEVAQQRWCCLAYCLMTNHYHLLIETPEPNLVVGMRRLNGVYTQTFNRRHNRVGHLFQGRYQSIIVEKQSHYLQLCRYVVLNPVRAGLVRRAQDWRWSSYRATAGLVSAPPWLDTDGVLSAFAPQKKKAIAAYRRFVREGLAAPSPWEQLRGQIWLGSEAFRQRMSARLKGRKDKAIPSRHRHPTRPTSKEVLARVARSYGIKAHAIPERTHQPAFKAAVYLLRRAANLPLADVAALMDISASRISQIQSEIENHPVGKGPLKALLETYKVKL